MKIAVFEHSSAFQLGPYSKKSTQTMTEMHTKLERGDSGRSKWFSRKLKKLIFSNLPEAFF